MKYYITTAIAYVNGAPHLGHALEFVQADAIARYHRERGDDTFFQTGTDEHGSKIARAAKKEGKTPQQLADQNAAHFQQLKEQYNLSYDYFIRTSDRKHHWPNAIALWNQLMDAGDLYKKKYQGLYCVGHEAFVTDKDLVNGKCQDHDKEPELIEEENYFFRLSKYAKKVGDSIRSGALKIYPEGRAHEILNFIDAGVEDISFSRPSKDLSWGIPVPGDDSQTMYVWADALTNYLYPDSSLSTASKTISWWPADLHVIGKDILRFHALYWPAMLMSAKRDLPRALFVHGFITVNGQKMSKSIGNVIDPVELVSRYGIDPVRYFFLRHLPTFNDGDFSDERFREIYQGELAHGLGNFAARVSKLAETLDVQAAKELSGRVVTAISESTRKYHAAMSDYRLNEALEVVWELMRFGDRYMNEKEPWKTGEKEVIAHCLVILKEVGELLKPFLPETADKILAENTSSLFPRLSE